MPKAPPISKQSSSLADQLGNIINPHEILDSFDLELRDHHLAPELTKELSDEHLVLLILATLQQGFERI